MSCGHDALRAFSGGRCPLCDGPAPIEVVVEYDADELPDPDFVPWRDPDAIERPPLPLGTGDPLDEAFERRHLARRATVELERRAVKRMRSSLAEFVRGAWHVKHGAKPLRWGPHLDALCNHMQWLLEGWLGRYADGREGVPLHVQDFVFNIAPLSLKSEIIMVYAPAWLWLHDASAEFGCVSGTPRNVDRDSNACRDLITSAWYRSTFRVRWEVRSDIDAVGKWQTTAGGSRTSQGMSASATGLHVDILLVDDPDDAFKVYGDAARRDVKGQFGALGNRLHSLERSLRIVVQQRVHPDDLSSELLERGTYALVLPLNFKPGKNRSTPWCPNGADWRTVEGDILHPDYSDAVIAKEKRRLGSAGFAAQYQQDPEPAGGNMFKRAWWRFFRLEDRPAPEGACPRPDGCVTFEQSPPVLVRYRRGSDGKARTTGDATAIMYAFDRVVVSVDATFGSLTDAASRVGLLAIGMRGTDRFVLDDKTKRMTLGQTEDAILAMVAAWGATKVIVEKKANGAAVIERLKSRVSGMVPVEPEGGKESRAAALQPGVEAGDWYLLEGAPWLERGRDEDDDGFMPEVSTFPNAKKDDRVDALSQLETHFQAAGPKRFLYDGIGAMA